MGKESRNSVWWSFIIMLCIGLLTGGRAQAEETQKTIQVAIPLMNDSGFVTYEDGEFKGYYIEYLEEIAKYTGWDYEYTAIESYEQLDAVCETGEFDLMAGIVYGEEYDELYFDYPKHSIGAKHYVLAVPKNSQLMPDNEYSFLRGVKVGVPGLDDELMQRFKEFCHMYGIVYGENAENFPMGVNFVQIDPASWREKLAEGEIDGLVASDAFCMSADMYAIATFGLDQIYFTVSKGNGSLLNELNVASEKIISFDPEYNENLYQKYFKKIFQYQASFDQEEEGYLKESRVWKVALASDLAPYSFVDEKGEPDGLIPHVLEAVTERTNGAMSFTFEFFDNLELAHNAVESGSCDIFGLSMYSDVVKKSDMRQSMSFYQDALCYYTSSDIKKTQEDNGSFLYNKAEEVLKKVEMGKEPYGVLLTHTGDYYQNYCGYALNEYQVPGGEVMFCFAYREDMDETAISVIDKVLVGLDEEELESYVINKCMFASRALGLWDYLWKYRYIIMILVAATLIIICILLLSAIINVTRNSKRVYELLYKDEIVDGISYKKFLIDAEEFRKKPGNKLILYINISGFKYINDVFGYEKGNEVLKTVKEFLSTRREEILSARSYADRFVVLITYDSLEEEKARIRKALEDFDEMAKKKYPSFNLWVKIGAYVLKPEDELQNAVNMANYAVDEIETKSENDFNFYDEAMHEEVLTYKKIEKDMWDALSNKEFQAFYQPKYDITTRKLIGAEALVRWHHREKGLLSPGMFIPIFEKNHFILQVDFYIFRCVCQFQKNRMEKGKKLFPISSNFSRLHLGKADFVEQLQAIAEEYQVPTEYLEIEITETIAMEEFDCLSIAVDKMKDFGFKVSIDDFGSGYSSIQLLYKIPIDVLKLDKAFVDNRDASEMELELVDDIIGVSQKNGIKIICEGVETQEQESFVRDHNCNFVQGFLYSKPLPEEAFLEILEKEI